ncbi:hypothetical protein BDZ97DRAFT_1852148, partial [Flammula alnicola]
PKLASMSSVDSATVQSLLQTNQAPSSSEEACIIDTICSLDDDLVAKDTLEYHLLSRLNTLQQEHKDLQSKRDRCSGILSSVRRVPEDIVSIIVGMAYCQDKPFQLLEYARVSLRWRAAILGTPRLWTFITLPKIVRVDYTRVISGINAWIRHSGVLPLTVSFDVNCAPASMKLLDALAIISGAEDKHRWTNMHIGHRFMSPLMNGEGPSNFHNSCYRTPVSVPRFHFPLVQSTQAPPGICIISI